MTSKGGGRGRCLICACPEKARIELACANGAFVDAVARQFQVSKWSLHRHWAKHVSDDKKASLRVVGMGDIKVDLDSLKRVESESLLQNLIAERSRFQRIADDCESVKNYKDAIRAADGVVDVMTLIAKYLGELRTAGITINNNFLTSPDWFALRKVITQALRPFPDAQKAVLDSVRAHETQAGVEVTHHRVIERPALPAEVTCTE